MTSIEHNLTNHELEGLQRALLEMLIEVDRICKKHEIRYVLFAGTLLGAVRHGGFIPWDDDLDIAMMRDEYIRFRQACAQDLDKSRFFFQDNITDQHYRWGYGRVLRLDTEFSRIGQGHMRMQKGIFLDIFPMDGVPEFAPFRGVHNFICFILRKLLYAEAGRKTGNSILIRLWYAIINIIPHNWIFAMMSKLTKFSIRSKYVRHIAFPTPKGRIYAFLREWFEDIIYIEFEGRLFPGIKDYHAFLFNHYGDYMQIPPPEKRHTHPVSKFKLPASFSEDLN